MKADIITFHFVNNFGGALQAYALQEIVKIKLGFESEIIDYRNSFIILTDTIRIFPVTKNFKELYSGFCTMGKRLDRLKKFESFRNEKMNLTDIKYHHYLLKKSPPESDVFICGSDQIWNPMLTFGVKGAYFLDFVPKGKKRISYAPSFGKGHIPQVFKEKIKSHLKKFDKISVREKTGIDIISELTGKEAVQLIDPTFLLTKDEWGELLDNSYQKKEPYILLYIMQSDKKMYEYAKALKEKMGYRIIEISRYGYNPGFIEETLVGIGPKEFITLIKNADYVCTNSYHGFIFSIIFEKKFCLIPCRRFRTRIYNLADKLSIKINENDTNNICDTEYDLVKVREKIIEERKKSIDWLYKAMRN